MEDAIVIIRFSGILILYFGRILLITAIDQAKSETTT
jgi:hypothetical protein